MIEPIWYDILFILCSLTCIVMFMMVLINRNPVYSVLFLIGGFIPLAVIYFLLNAYFIGIIQILVYAGAIMVLFTFVIMMIDLSKDEYLKEKSFLYKLSAVIGVTIVTLMIIVPIIVHTSGKYNKIIIDNESKYGEIDTLGKFIFSSPETNYAILSFELVSILILTAIIGTLIIAKKRRDID